MQNKETTEQPSKQSTDSATGIIDDLSYIKAMKRVRFGAWQLYDFLLDCRIYGWDYCVDAAKYVCAADLKNIGTITVSPTIGSGIEKELIDEYRSNNNSIEQMPALKNETGVLTIGGSSSVLNGAPVKIVWFNQSNRIRIITISEDEDLLCRYCESLIRRNFNTPDAMKRARTKQEPEDRINYKCSEPCFESNLQAYSLEMKDDYDNIFNIELDGHTLFCPNEAESNGHGTGTLLFICRLSKGYGLLEFSDLDQSGASWFLVSISDRAYETLKNSREPDVWLSVNSKRHQDGFTTLHPCEISAVKKILPEGSRFGESTDKSYYSNAGMQKEQKYSAAGTDTNSSDSEKQKNTVNPVISQPAANNGNSPSVQKEVSYGKKRKNILSKIMASKQKGKISANLSLANFILMPAIGVAIMMELPVLCASLLIMLTANNIVVFILGIKGLKEYGKTEFTNRNAARQVKSNSICGICISGLFLILILFSFFMVLKSSFF